jgi:hypothetical protein
LGRQHSTQGRSTKILIAVPAVFSMPVTITAAIPLGLLMVICLTLIVVVIIIIVWHLRRGGRMRLRLGPVIVTLYPIRKRRR